MKKLFVILLIFVVALSGCQNDLSKGDTFSGFEGYTNELTEEELANAIKSGKVELQNRPDEYICYVTITCKTAMKSEKLKPAMQKILPSDGVILEKYTVDFSEGETIFEVVSRVTKENKIHMEYSGNAKIPYIEGISNLYEFECGPLSGWMYRVNSWFPSFSMGQYKVERGDEIELVYTCNLGEDVGDNYMNK